MPEDEWQTAPTNVFFPCQPWKENWDVLILFLILYSAVIVPFRICFDAEASGWVWWGELTMTFLFLSDLIMTFNTAFKQDERWVISRPLIARNYLGGWFWIDFPSSIPVELLDLWLQGDASNLKLLRFLRLFRLLRLLRLLKLGTYLDKLEEKLNLNLEFISIIKMIGNLLFLAHMLGCFWFYTASQSDATVTWVHAYDDGSGGMCYHPAAAADCVEPGVETQYLYSVYWALTTLTTVGYGDITPTNQAERVYTIMTLIIGALVFGYMLSQIASLVAAMDRQACIVEEKMGAVKEYLRWRSVPRELRARVKKYYEYYYTRATAFDEGEILGHLTPALRFDVTQWLLKETLGNLPLFTRLAPEFQMALFPCLKPVSFAAKEKIVIKGDEAHDLFFLLRGEVNVLSSVDGRVLFQVLAGSYFGESVLTGRRRESTYVAATWCELFSLSKADIGGLFERHPLAAQRVQHAVLAEYERKEKLRANALGFLLRSMKQGPQRAAMVLQRAWAAYTKRKADHRSLFPAKRRAGDDPAHGAAGVAAGGAAGPGVGAAAMAQLEEESAQQLRELGALGQSVAELGKQMHQLQAQQKQQQAPTPDGAGAPASEMHADLKRLLRVMQKAFPDAAEGGLDA